MGVGDDDGAQFAQMMTHKRKLLAGRISPAEAPEQARIKQSLMNRKDGRS